MMTIFVIIATKENDTLTKSFDGYIAATRAAAVLEQQGYEIRIKRKSI